MLWWSPDPREVLLPQRVSSLAQPSTRALRTRGFMAAADRDFAAVVAACAAPRARSPGTWITAEMHAAYCGLHERGLAHSYEIWRGERLVGGVYGVRLGSRVLRRIDVQPRARRLKGRAGGTGRAQR